MQDRLTLADGTRLVLHHWPREAAKGSVLLVHGIGEHAGRYAHVAARLVAAGWRVVAHDQRGHGRSDGPRGVIPQPLTLLSDLAAVIDALRAAHPGPLVLLGHSMGGLVAARFVAEGTRERPAGWHRAVDALVLSSPALDPGLGAFQKALIALLEPLLPNLAVGNGLKTAWISRSAATVAAYEADPLVHDRVSPRLARFIADESAFTRSRAPHWTLPTLLMWAGADRCVAPAGSAAFAAAAPAGIVDARPFPALFHEIFNEPEQQQVLDTLVGWLDVHGA